MARGHYSEDSDSDLPELDELISRHVKGLRVLNAPKLDTTKTAATRLSPQKVTGKPLTAARSGAKTCKTTKDSEPEARLKATLTLTSSREAPETQQRPRQRAPARQESKVDADVPRSSKARATPHRKVKVPSSRQLLLLEDPEEEESKDKVEEQDIEESIWCESDLDEKPRILATRSLGQPTRRPISTPDTELSDSDDDLPLRPMRRLQQKPQPSSRAPEKASDDLTQKLLQLDLDSDKENDNRALLRFSPPRLARPILERPATPPPASPSKSRLVSPSKKKPRIPTPPHAPHIEDFWNVHAVNNWNDHHSPQKPLLSPKKNKKVVHDDSDSPLSSPKKSQSPSKRSRAVLDAKKDFENRKHQLAEDFFQELDSKITEGKIKDLATATGGVKFIWSKTLNSTAGRANWKRETSKIRNLDGTTTITQKHHASIELAEKVIDDEERLLNVVAHEFCHLANFMVSGIKDQPHGHQFKIWGRKCSEAFGDRGVEVTTKHTYRIDYKYIWTCTNDLCGHEFKRHSKSIDPARHTCGVCRGKLAQTKPVPRKQAGATGYAAFVKEHFASLKSDMAGASHKEVMAALGQKYREQKAAANNEGAATASIDDMAKALEVVTLDSD